MTAESLEARAERSPAEGDELRATAAQHRASAQEHLERAKIDERRLAELVKDS